MAQRPGRRARVGVGRQQNGGIVRPRRRHLVVMLTVRRLWLRLGGDAMATGRRLDRGLAAGVEAGDAVPRRVRGRVPLLVARQQVESHKLLVAVAHVAAVDLLGVVCCFWHMSALHGGNETGAWDWALLRFS